MTLPKAEFCTGQRVGVLVTGQRVGVLVTGQRGFRQGLVLEASASRVLVRFDDGACRYQAPDTLVLLTNNPTKEEPMTYDVYAQGLNQAPF